MNETLGILCKLPPTWSHALYPPWGSGATTRRVPSAAGSFGRSGDRNASNHVPRRESSCRAVMATGVPPRSIIHFSSVPSMTAAYFSVSLSISAVKAMSPSRWTVDRSNSLARVSVLDRSEPASLPYAHRGSLFDVTSGRNGSCGKNLCTARPGWDGPTGLGTPNGVGAFSTS